MVEPLKPLVPEGGQSQGPDDRSVEQRIYNTHSDELIIGLCGPIGTDIHFVATSLEKILSEQFNYNCIPLRLSKFITNYSDIAIPDKALDPFKHKKVLIEAGNQLREKHSLNILAEIVINEITVEREKHRRLAGVEEFTGMRTCYIIDSIKNVEELKLLRLVYNDLFYFFGVYSSLEIRKTHLINSGIDEVDVFKLINQDSGEEISHGQQVTKTFKQADFFMRIDQSAHSIVENKIKRYLHLIFSTDIITPTSDETAMYLAATAASNSACLARQVGATITDSHGEVISVGWNDVPKFKGNLYQTSFEDPIGQKDYRCMNLEAGKCFNDKEKKFIANELVKALMEDGIITAEQKKKTFDVIQNSRIQDLIEFSRAVHAEMHAIITASKKAGTGLKNGKLFCTTYPCHNCARHIVAAGITEVYYIEPYRKSLATKLHEDTITENETISQKVRILMFDGVAPNRYLKLFNMLEDSRKKDGKKIQKSPQQASPKKTLSLQAIPILEGKVTEDLKNRDLI